MSILPEELVNLLKDHDSVKILSTTDENGVPHAVAKGSLTTLDGITIAFNEGLDTNISNKNLVRSIWFDKSVAINVTKGGVSYQIKGKPYKCLITGPVYKEFLLKARERRGPDADIAAVWIVKPDEVRNETPAIRRKEEEEKRPFFNRHLDRASIKKTVHT
ncbi:MAG: hypothetical protein FD174_2171 [Geobacteraceae bacterium]|nr:MAG: hypothetical protein FD174_2171 [Geobacteraceae bacterium]